MPCSPASARQLQPSRSLPSPFSKRVQPSVFRSFFSLFLFLFKFHLWFKGKLDKHQLLCAPGQVDAPLCALVCSRVIILLFSYDMQMKTIRLIP